MANLVKELEIDSPKLGSNGQNLEPLLNDSIVLSNKPQGGYKKHGYDTYHLTRYEETNLVQWVGRRSSGYFYPSGKVMEITSAGLKALKQNLNKI